MTTSDSAVADLVDALKLDARAKLLDLLDEVGGRKVLILDSTIVGPLDLIVNPSDLTDHGVQNWYKLSDQPVQSDCTQIVFLIRCARVELADWIAKQILEDEANGKDRMYVVILLPKKTEQCMQRLGRANVRANVRIVEFGLHFFPFDRDILSMEAPGAFHDFHVQGDPSGLFYVAKALMFLQSQFGLIPSVHAIGSAAKCVLDTMLRLRKEEAMSDASQDPQSTKDIGQPGVPPVAPRTKRKEDGVSSAAPKISEVVIIDRRVDPYSILCSQFTYQSLIDMVFGIQNNGTDISSVDWAKDRHSHIRLSSDVPLYQEIRDVHIDKLGPLLNQRATEIQNVYKEKDNVKNPNEMADFLKKFKIAQAAHPLLELHINLAQQMRKTIQEDDYQNHLRMEDCITAQSSGNILECIEDLIDDQKPIYEVLRLLCLYSLCNNGVKPKQLDQLKRCIIQSYGYEHVLTLCNMERVGMLRYQQGKSVWPNIKRHFNLLVEDTQMEKDVCYAYSGYAPLSVRLVQMTKGRPGGWRSCQDALSLLWGPAQDLHQQPESGSAAAAAGDGTGGGSPSVVLVCFLGGVTYGEIAALRRLSELEEGRRKFLIFTTEFISSKSFLQSLRCEQVFNQPPVEAKTKAKPQEAKRGFGFFR